MYSFLLIFARSQNRRVGLIGVCYFRKNTVCLSGAVFFEATNFYRAGQHSVDLYVIHSTHLSFREEFAVFQLQVYSQKSMISVTLFLVLASICCSSSFVLRTSTVVADNLTKRMLFGNPQESKPAPKKQGFFFHEPFAFILIFEFQSKEEGCLGEWET